MVIRVAVICLVLAAFGQPAAARTGHKQETIQSAPTGGWKSPHAADVPKSHASSYGANPWAGSSYRHTPKKRRPYNGL
jgi:hypothetical protein